MIERAGWQRMLDARIDNGKLRGVAATVILADQGVWSGAAGTSDGVKALQPEAQFAIASLTKTVIAAQVLRLAEEGSIDLDTQAAEYLPVDIPLDPNGATVRQLLGMRGGIVDPPWRKGDWGWGPGWIPLDPTRRWTLMETLEGFAAAGTDYVAPGGRPGYSNASYALLGALIEHVDGRPIAAVLRSDVLAHEGLERLIMQVDERPTEPLAQPLTDLHPDALAAAFEAGGGYLPTAFDASLNTAHGGMASDTASLARWLYLLFGGDVVSDASLREMTGAENGPYGLWQERDPSGWGFAGLKIPGYATYFVVRPNDGIVVVCFTNESGPEGETLGAVITLGRALADRASA
jgi:CubicO group peptidase (beta-lactamase class C family)